MTFQPTLEPDAELTVEEEVTDEVDELPEELAGSGGGPPIGLEIHDDDLSGAENAVALSLTLGFVSFDGETGDNDSSPLLVSHEHRALFQRDAYVGSRTGSKELSFSVGLSRVHSTRSTQISADSAISRTTLLHPDRTGFRAEYYAAGTIEILGEIQDDGSVRPTPTRPRSLLPHIPVST